MPPRMRSTRYDYQMGGASQVLDAVQMWADRCFLLRETGVITNGRLDGLLVPYNWDSPMAAGLYGIEVKTSRSDFLRGLKEGQFEKYQDQLTGLYLAAHPQVCKTSELPRGVGHLVYVGSGRAVVCRRRAAKRDYELTRKMLWKLLYDLMDQQQRQIRHERQVITKTLDRIKEHVGDRLVKTAHSIELSMRSSQDG